MTTRVQDYGGISGDVFDDGVNDYVRKVIVGEDSHGIAYIKIEYVKDGAVVQREHGKNTGTQTEVFYICITIHNSLSFFVCFTYKITLSLRPSLKLITQTNTSHRFGEQLEMITYMGLVPSISST